MRAGVVPFGMAAIRRQEVGALPRKVPCPGPSGPILDRTVVVARAVRLGGWSLEVPRISTCRLIRAMGLGVALLRPPTLARLLDRDRRLGRRSWSMKKVEATLRWILRLHLLGADGVVSR